MRQKRKRNIVFTLFVNIAQLVYVTLSKRWLAKFGSVKIIIFVNQTGMNRIDD